MSITRLRAECLACLGRKQLNRYPETAPEEVRLEYTRKVLQILAQATEDEAAPVVVNRIDRLRESMFGAKDEYAEIKRYFNDVLLAKEEELLQNIETAHDPLLLALQYAMAGNYIDFGVMEQVEVSKLNEMLQEADKLSVNLTEYDYFVKELSTCRRLAYLTDNCGEIALDKLLIATIQKRYPHIAMTAIVRGSYVQNDATMEDAMQVGLDRIVPTIPNSSNIAGTWENALSPEALDTINQADVIVSKGQGNFETLRYCGRNIYYIFLCKCDMLAKDCNVPRMTGMFVNDGRLGE